MSTLKVTADVSCSSNGSISCAKFACASPYRCQNRQLLPRAPSLLSAPTLLSTLRLFRMKERLTLWHCEKLFSYPLNSFDVTTLKIHLMLCVTSQLNSKTSCYLAVKLYVYRVGCPRDTRFYSSIQCSSWVCVKPMNKLLCFSYKS